MTGTQISDMTISATMPSGAFVPFVASNADPGFSLTQNYIYDLGADLLNRVSYTALAASDGATFVGIEGGGDVQSYITDVGTAGASTGGALIGFIQSGTGAVGRTSQDKERERLSVADYTNMATGLAAGRSILLNPDSYLFQTGEDIGAGTALYGDGVTSEVTVQATPSLPNLYAFTLASNSSIADIPFTLDANGENWAAAVGYPSAASNIRIEGLSFASAGAADGAYAEYINGADVADVLHRNLTFDTIALPQHKGNLDTSVQTRWSYSGYRAFNGIDGFNANSPKGEFSHGYLEDTWVKGMTQFGFAFAKVDGWYGTIRGDDNDYELAHIEDATTRFKFYVVGQKNNLLPGTAGSPAAANGAVSIIGGSNAGLLTLSLDLTQNPGGSPVGVCIQAGGPRVSDGLTVNPYNIQIGGNIRGGAGRIAVIALEATDRIVLNHLSVESEPLDVMDPCLSIPGSNVGGELYLKTPGIVFEGNDNTPMTGLDTLVLSDVTDDFTAWTDGVTTDRTAIQLTQLLKINRAFTADVAATWQPIMPVFRDCRVRAAWKFQQNGTANGALVLCDNFVIESGALVSTPVIVRSGGSSDPVPGHASAVTPTGDTSNGKTILTNLSSDSGILPGHDITGTGIPSGTKVQAVLSATSIALTKAATATGTGVSLSIRTPPTTDLSWRVNSGMLECRIYNGTTANGTLSLVMLGLMTA